MARLSPLMLLPPLIFAALAATFYIGMNRKDPDALPSVIVGQPAPPLRLTPLAELPGLDDATLRTGGVKIVNFWASWCAPCRVEHPHLMALAAEGIPVYGVNYKDDPAKGRGFLQDLGNPFAAVGRDENGRTGIDWGLYGVPETFVLAPDGTVILRFAGPLTDRVIAETLRPALARAAGG